MSRGPRRLNRRYCSPASRGLLGWGGEENETTLRLELGGDSAASAGNHALGFRAYDVRWAGHVLKELYAGGGVTSENPSRVGFEHSGPFRASTTAKKAFCFAERNNLCLRY